MRSFNTWTFKDRHPDIPLQNIKSVAERAYSLLNRNRESLVNLDGAMNLIGALDIMEAFEYHFNNYLRQKDTAENKFQKHEAVAYLNRIGQLFFFAKSSFVQKIVPNSIEMVPKVKELVILRMKNTAHRSIDYPKNESDEFKEWQALALLDVVYHQVQGKQQYRMPIQTDSGETDWICFTPETDHHIVMTESYRLLEAIVQNISN